MIYLRLNLFIVKCAKTTPTAAPRGTNPKQGPIPSYSVMSGEKSKAHILGVISEI